LEVEVAVVWRGHAAVNPGSWEAIVVSKSGVFVFFAHGIESCVVSFDAYESGNAEFFTGQGYLSAFAPILLPRLFDGFQLDGNNFFVLACG
jgi:hypothetical protein